MSVLRKKMRGVTAGLTTVAMVLQPQLLVAGETAAPVPSNRVATTTLQTQAPSDVVLQDKGVLLGRIVDERGEALPNTLVSLQTGGKEVARVMSNDLGRFQAEGLQGGVYHVASTGHQGVYRLWAPRTAPPAAARGLSIVSQRDIVRGQFNGGPSNPFAAAGQWIAEHPIITAGAIATAIAVPIAVADDDDDPPASP
ncbi:MAG: carboxypeptidase-like regulatory domain-containing protein [Bythopirellula sp.]